MINPPASSLVALFLLASTAAQAAHAQSDFSGKEWRTWHAEVRAMYVAGWTDGRAHGVWEAINAVQPELFGKTDDPRLASLSLSTNVRQLVSGLDTFYGDYRNQLIDLPSAIGIALDEASGRRLWTEEQLQRLRQKAAEPHKERSE